jgi:hypothetical protein
MQALRIARHVPMSFFEKSQTRKRTKRKTNATAKKTAMMTRMMTATRSERALAPVGEG